MKEKRMYIGDGVFATDDGFQITLSTQRHGRDGEDVICLDDQTLKTLFLFLEHRRGLTITVSKTDPANPTTHQETP